jgi:FixJ family two-component response regulator
MPGLTGLQLQNQLAELGRRLPVVFISGHGDIPTSVRAMKGGADDFLTKPVDTDVLLDAISRAIARSRKEQESRARLDALQVRVDALTPTERKVFALVMQKLQVDTLAELVSLAERLRLVVDHDRPSPDED